MKPRSGRRVRRRVPGSVRFSDESRALLANDEVKKAYLGG